MKMRGFQVQAHRAIRLAPLSPLKNKCPNGIYGDCLNSRLDIVRIFGKLVAMPVYAEQNRSCGGLSQIRPDSQVYSFQGDLHE